MNRHFETHHGVPVPPVVGFGQTSADLVEAIAYGGFRPGEILAVLGRHYAPADLGKQYVHVCQRNVDGEIVRGTKSKRYPEKDVYLLGPLPAIIARRAATVGSDGILFPYPVTHRLWTESEYRNWREDYFVPIARSHGLGSESDDPYALRHIYATLRIAAHHPTLYIESSMVWGAKIQVSRSERADLQARRINAPHRLPRRGREPQRPGADHLRGSLSGSEHRTHVDRRRRPGSGAVLLVYVADLKARVGSEHMPWRGSKTNAAILLTESASAVVLQSRAFTSPESAASK
jgi:hypothetical protein